MSTTRFDLVDIIRIIERRKRFIIIVTLVAMVLGLVFHLARKKKYEAKAAFFVSNPIYSDRSTIFGGGDSRYTDYFGGEDDIDRVIALSESDTIITQIIRNTGYDKMYNLDLTKPEQRHELKELFKDNLEIKRTEYKLMELYFTDPNPEMAAKVANEAVKDIELGYRNFYNSRRTGISDAISSKLVEIDSSINAFTDTLTRLRSVSGIYDIISPNRENLVTSRIQSTAKDPGKYIELIQNFESVKDMLVLERARYIALQNQYATGVQEGEMKLFHSITVAKPPVETAGPGLVIILAASFFLGLFFSILYVLLTTYYREALAVRS